MNYKPLQLKIIIIFSIPAIALIYFSFSFIDLKYQKLNKNSIYILSAQITNSLSKLIHNIQIERGLSAGYIVSTDKNKYKDKLLKQHKTTDKAYNDFLFYVTLKSPEKQELMQILENKNTTPIKKAIDKIYLLNQTRQNVLNSSISFIDEIDYYTDINTQLLIPIKNFTIFLNKQTNDNNALVKLQEQKENAGLERAYIYNQLLSNALNSQRLTVIKELAKKQTTLKNEFHSNASIDSILIYNNILDINIENELTNFRDNFFKNRLDSKNATEWFELSSKYIDKLEKTSSTILNRYIENANKIKDDSKKSLFITALLWSLSLISFTLLVYVLKNLINKESNLMDKLRIAAYTFDSHEAMTITDANGTIIDVNRAFTDITGYQASEVIGKNPRVLKSMKHNDEFYKEMWHQIHSVGKWSDEIYNKRKNDEIYLERLSITAIKDDNDITTHYIAQFLDISDLKEAQEKAEHQADHDFLTGLLNRKALMQRLSEEFIKARRHDFLHSFLFIDLDSFKSINDNYGHNVGDKLLLEVSQRVKSMLREEDILSRISGDEFAIIILNIDTDEQEAAKNIKDKCSKILQEIAKPFVINEHKLNISASIGIKLFPDEEKSIQDVIIHADTAMYQAKHEGKNRFVFFDKNIELELKQLSLLEEEINQAYKNREFVFFFQPKVSTTSGNICGAELLIRWLHPHKGILYPDSFLKVTTEMGLLPKITELAIENACTFIKSNKNIFKGKIAININSNELLSPIFATNLISTIEHYGINANQIELEIVEDELIKDFDTAIDKIKTLKKYGIKFSIDDFGTGYSSITYLNKLPVNTLKIDRKFMQNLTEESNRELIKIIINMAKTFNIQIVVEGVESKAQLQFITENGADTYQGFYFSRAVDEKSFIKLLS